MTPDDHRRNAQECLAKANSAHNERDKAAWLKIAEEWQKLAEEAERRAASNK